MGNTYMSIEYLHFAQEGMFNDDAGGRFANKPVAGYDIDWCAI
jgi:hypothetical protein